MAIRTLCVMFALLMLVPSTSKTENTKMLKPNIAQQTKTTGEVDRKRIEKFILTVKPGSPKFAKRLSKYIVASAKQNKISPYVVATTGYVESEFNMDSSPCVGIMQVEMSTYKSTDKSSGLNPHKMRDNIELGSRELSRYYYNTRGTLASRGGNYSRLRYMWGRYNGCGSNPRNHYIKKVFTVHYRIQKETTQQWQERLKKQHTLWKK